jgi:glycosyltransferase involved in cell wall biosynthesis
MAKWHIITGEYPPQAGGVSHYTHQVVQALARNGEEVNVWVPRSKDQTRTSADPALAIHELESHFRIRDLRRMSKHMKDSDANTRVLIQYVPQAFGFKSLNIFFCLWVAAQSRMSPWIMFHEVAYPISISQPAKHNLLGIVHRLMAVILKNSAKRILISTSAWEPLIGPRCEWLPVPSTIAPDTEEAETSSIRRHYGKSGLLMGHFGTFNERITALLDGAIPLVLEQSALTNVLLMGSGSKEYAARLTSANPKRSSRIYGTGPLPARSISRHLSACDLLLQPFVDGVTTRRTSVMAGLSHGCAVVSNAGHLTEKFWRSADALALCKAPDPSELAEKSLCLLLDPPARLALGQRGLKLYEAKFALEHTMRSLLQRA